MSRKDIEETTETARTELDLKNFRKNIPFLLQTQKKWVLNTVFFCSFGKKGYPLYPCQRLQIYTSCAMLKTPRFFARSCAFRSFHPHPPDFPEVSYIMTLEGFEAFLKNLALGKKHRKQQSLREFPGRGDIKPLYIKMEDFDILQSFGACWRFDVLTQKRFGIDNLKSVLMRFGPQESLFKNPNLSFSFTAWKM